jgi:hypothetical protein
MFKGVTYTLKHVHRQIKASSAGQEASPGVPCATFIARFVPIIFGIYATRTQYTVYTYMRSLLLVRRNTLGNAPRVDMHTQIRTQCFRNIWSEKKALAQPYSLPDAVAGTYVIM